MAITLKTRFPLLLLLLGIVFLALVCVSSGIAQYEQGNPCHKKCLQRCNKVNAASRRNECRSRCKGWPERCAEEEEEERPRPGRRERGRQEGEKEEEQRERHEPRREKKQQEEERENRVGNRRESEEERRNPFFFRSNKFQTLFENENGRIRLLRRFDKSSNQFQNLQNYRLVEYRSKPHTLLLPQHTDADFILLVLNGRAILTVVNPNDRNSFNLERGDAITLPAGTTTYLANQDDNEDLRVVHLAIPVNKPGQFQSFSPSSSQSYFHGFSKDFLEASFNTDYEEIERVLLEEQQEQGRGQQQRRGHKERQQSQEANPIAKVSREQIEELTRNAKSSSRKSKSSESQLFNLRSRNPIYSNKFGKFFEITPKNNPQLEDLNLFLSLVEIREGAIMLPHYNSRAFVILVVNEGKGNLELVAPRNEQQEEEQQQEEDESRQVQRYRARLSPGDVVVIPASHPVSVNASSDLSFIGFGINAENNQRNFLAGEEDNVISQIHRAVKDLAFPGSAQEVDKLIKNQRQSYFANAQPQQREEGSQRKRGPLSSILGAFY